MKIDHILKLYQESEKLVSFADHLKTDRGGKFQIKGLVGSQSVFSGSGSLSPHSA
ncbi:MAG: hypothetical protein R3B93_16915 [Bacteroidia bacterium]